MAAKAKKRKNTRAQEEAVRTCYDWFERDRNAKQFVVDEWKEMYKLYKGDHWDLTGSNGEALRTAEQQSTRPNCVENVSFALVEGIASEFAQEVELIDIPVEDGDEDMAVVMTDLKRFILYKNEADRERIKFLRWGFLYGTFIKHIYWDPSWRGGRGPNRWEGDIRWRALHPLCLFPDARCKTDINEGYRCHKRVWVPLEMIKEKYPEAAGLITEEMMSESDDYIDDEQVDSEGGGSYEFTQNQVPIIETWYKGEPLILDDGEKGEGYGLHVIWWAGENQMVYLRHANYIYFDPEETVYFPFITEPCYPRENSIWGFGEMYYLKNPQVVMNKTAEIILEGHLHNAIGQTWYNETALTPKQQRLIREKGTLPGMWFPVRDFQAIHREYARNVPITLQNEMQRLQRVMETIMGRFDVSQGRTPGSVTAFRAIAELSARAQVRMRIKEMAVTSVYRRAGQYVNRLIEKFYTEQRKYRILGKEDETPVVAKRGTFDMEDMLKVYNYDTGENSRLSNIPFSEEARKSLYNGFRSDENTEELPEGVREEVAMHGSFEVYFPEFDTMVKTTSVAPADRIYNMEIAKDLMVAKVIDTEMFLYVMKNGRFPPIEELMRKVQSPAMPPGIPPKMPAQPPGMPPGAQAGAPPIVPEMPPGVTPGILEQGEGQDAYNEAVQFLALLPEDVRAQLAALPPEQAVEIVRQLMRQAGYAAG